MRGGAFLCQFTHQERPSARLLPRRVRRSRTLVSQMEALVDLAALLLSYFRGWRQEADLHRVIEGEGLGAAI